MIRKKEVIFIIIIIIFSGWTNQKPATAQIFKKKKELSYIPVGVDSSLALAARAKAAKLFAPLAKKLVADSLYEYSKKYLTITHELYNKIKQKKDELKELRNKIRRKREELKKKKSFGLEERKQFTLLLEKAQDDSATIEIVMSLLEYYLFHCRDKLDYAYKIDPFNLNLLFLSALSEWDRGLMYQDSLAFRNAIEQLQKYLIYDRSDYQIYREISHNYYQLKQWKKAHEYARKAKEIFVITSYFNPEKEVDERYKNTTLPPNADPKDYFDCLMNKALTELKVYEADSALATFEEAVLFAPTKKDSNTIKIYVKNWIKWDDKNIRAAERRMEIIDSLNSGNYKWALKAYEDLLPQLKTKRARDEIHWNIARLEFSFFEKYEEAAKRLYYNVITQSDSIPQTINFYEAPNDSMYKVYFRDCGQWFLDIGKRFRDKGEREKARFYLAQDTTIEWSGRYKAFIPLAQVVDVPSNLKGAERVKVYNKKRLKLLLRARNFREKLNMNEINQLYRAIIQIYRQEKKKREMQFFFHEFNQIKNKK